MRTSRSTTRWPSPRGEEGFSLPEVLVAVLIGAVVLSMVSMAAVATTRSASDATALGSSTGPALIAVDGVQQILSAATDAAPFDGAFDCAGTTSGGAFPSGTGPFAATPTMPSSNSIEFCAVRSGSTTAYTYELYFPNATGCTGTTCTLELDQWPAEGCTGTTCTTVVVSKWADVSDASPFTFYCYSGGWTTSGCTAGSIEAVRVSLTVSAPGDEGVAVQRMVVLPNTLNGGS